MKKGLGRGLNALIDGVNMSAEKDKVQNEERVKLELVSSPPTQSAGNALMVDIRKVEPNPTQPRQYFDDEALVELAESMKTFGIVQPLLVTNNNGLYTIIAGERRYRAARLAKLEEVPVIIKDYTEMEILQVALIENIQRQDLTAMEEATCYKRLIDDFFFSAEDVASKLGKNKHAIISSLHLLELSPKAQELAAQGKLTASHAKVLLSIEDPELQGECAEKIINDDLSVRGAANMVTSVLKTAAKKAIQPPENEEKEDELSDENSAFAYKRAEYELKRVLGSQVHIRPGKKKSKIEIEYYSSDDLERILHIFRKLPRIETRT